MVRSNKVTFLENLEATEKKAGYSVELLNETGNWLGLWIGTKITGYPKKIHPVLM